MSFETSPTVICKKSPALNLHMTSARDLYFCAAPGFLRVLLGGGGAIKAE